MHADVGGAVLRYRDLGHGGPVLFVHGFPLSGDLWLPAVERLGPGSRCIVPDLRGHGASQVTDGTSMARYADDLAALLDAAGEERPVVLVGLSMGGYIALEFCRRHPDRVRALALVDTRAEADSTEAAEGRRATAERVLVEGSGVVADGILSKLFAHSAPEGLRERWWGIMAATPPRGAAAALRAMADRPDSFATLRALDRPVLIVVGEEDNITPPESARRMEQAARDARMIVIPGAGHMTPVEQPDRFAEVLREFLGHLGHR